MVTAKERIKRVFTTPISGQQIFMLAFVFYLLIGFLMDTSYSDLIGIRLLKLVSYLPIPFLIFKIFALDQWQWWQKLLITVILCISVIVWRKTGNTQIMLTTFFVTAAKEVNFGDIMKWYFYLSATFLMIIMAIALINIIPDYIYYSDSRATRYALGMVYPSLISAHLVFTVLAYCYLKFPKLNWLDYLSFIVLGAIAMKLTDTRLDYLEIFLIVIVMWIAQRAQRGGKVTRLVAPFFWMATPILAAVMIEASVFYSSSNKILAKLNDVFSGRLALGWEGFHRYPLTLFGQQVKEHSYIGSAGAKLANNGTVGANYFYIDSSYVRLFLIWGLVIFAIVMIVITYITIRETYLKQYILPAILLIVAVNSMLEPHIVELINNPFILALLASSVAKNYLQFGEDYENKVHIREHQ